MCSSDAQILFWGNPMYFRNYSLSVSRRAGAACPLRSKLHSQLPVRFFGAPHGADDHLVFVNCYVRSSQQRSFLLSRHFSSLTPNTKRGSRFLVSGRSIQNSWSRERFTNALEEQALLKELEHLTACSELQVSEPIGSVDGTDSLSRC